MQLSTTATLIAKCKEIDLKVQLQRPLRQKGLLPPLLWDKECGGNARVRVALTGAFEAAVCP